MPAFVSKFPYPLYIIVGGINSNPIPLVKKYHLFSIAEIINQMPMANIPTKRFRMNLTTLGSLLL
jgi:hypothetical protein